mmetsp:Transcript_25905/g.60459  ORF Transcript_25905/g.60459 Transcript_25905/m.60459 type:complete len:217 (-) Transcript_25905:87-737(-)
MRRRECSSTWPTRRKDGAARQVMAHRSLTIVSGGWSRPRSSSAYHMRRTYCERDATSERARVVGTPSASIASETRNSRTDERRTARPSPPREKGVVPPPLSCSSHRAPADVSTSPSEMARPSPYPLPRPNGSGAIIGCPKTETAYGVAHPRKPPVSAAGADVAAAGSPFATSMSPEKKRANASERRKAASSSSEAAMRADVLTRYGDGSAVGRTCT